MPYAKPHAHIYAVGPFLSSLCSVDSLWRSVEVSQGLVWLIHICVHFKRGQVCLQLSLALWAAFRCALHWSVRRRRFQSAHFLSIIFLCLFIDECCWHAGSDGVAPGSSGGTLADMQATVELWSRPRHRLPAGLHSRTDGQWSCTADPKRYRLNLGFGIV